MKNNLAHLTLAQQLRALKNGELSLTGLYSELANNIEQKNPHLNIFLNLEKKALSKANLVKSKPLAGLPIAIKDNFCTKDLNTTASSRILEKMRPPFNSTVVNKIQEAGGVVIGKTNLDAWAHGSSTETSDFGCTLNPRNPDYLPGGSSGGSAAAVAAELCSAAIGSETAGSIRQPAAWCGVVGLKPTYGRVSRYGVAAMASSTDSPGPMTKTVEDSALLLNYLAGNDPLDATTSPSAVPDYTLALNKSIKGLKIGVLYQDLKGLESIQPLFQKELHVFKELGAIVEPTSALDPHYAIGVYTVIQRAEVSSNLARLDGIRYGLDRTHFGDEAKRRIMLGTYALSKGYADKYYLLAQKVRTLFTKDFARLFNKFDVLISPTSPGFAKKVGSSKGVAMFGELEDMLLEPSSIAGLPGINVPCYQDPATKLFLGMNIITSMLHESLMISVADAYEKNSSWNSWRSSQSQLNYA